MQRKRLGQLLRGVILVHDKTQIRVAKWQKKILNKRSGGFRSIDPTVQIYPLVISSLKKALNVEHFAATRAP